MEDTIALDGFSVWNVIRHDDGSYFDYPVILNVTQEQALAVLGRSPDYYIRVWINEHWHVIDPGGIINYKTLTQAHHVL